MRFQFTLAARPGAHPVQDCRADVYSSAWDCTALYLGPLVRVSDLPGRRRLRSTSTDRLVVPPFKLSTNRSRTFNIAAARTWNGLPEDVTSSPTLPTFCKRLKTHLFLQSYPKIVP